MAGKRAGGVGRVLRAAVLGTGLAMVHQPTPVRAAPPAAVAEADDGPAPAAPGQTAKKLLDEANKAVLMNNFLDAVRLGKRALLLDPKLVDAHKVIGVAYARLGRYCSAKTHYKAFVDARPDSPMADRINMLLDSEGLKECP